MIEPRLRQAIAADVNALEALEQVFPGNRLSRRSWRHLVTHGNAVILVAEDDELLGNAVVLFRKGSSLSRLYSLVVAPAAQGRGLGKQLLRAAEAAAQARGCSAMTLEVREDNHSALALYQHAGFKTGQRLEDYYQDGGTALRMSKRLGWVER